VLVIIYWDLGFPQGHLQSGGSLRRKGVLPGTGWVTPIEWGGHKVRTGGLGVDLGSIGPGNVGQDKAPEAPGPDFTGIFIPRISSSISKAKMWNCVPMAEVDKVAHRIVVFPQVLCFLPTLGSCSHPSYYNPTGLFQTGP
jgi:hypothetical protein